MYGLQVHALCIVDGLWKAVLIKSVEQCCMRGLRSDWCFLVITLWQQLWQQGWLQDLLSHNCRLHTVFINAVACWLRCRCERLSADGRIHAVCGVQLSNLLWASPVAIMSLHGGMCNMLHKRIQAFLMSPWPFLRDIVTLYHVSCSGWQVDRSHF